MRWLLRLLAIQMVVALPTKRNGFQSQINHWIVMINDHHICLFVVFPGLPCISILQTLWLHWTKKGFSRVRRWQLYSITFHHHCHFHFDHHDQDRSPTTLWLLSSSPSPWSLFWCSSRSTSTLQRSFEAQNTTWSSLRTEESWSGNQRHPWHDITFSISSICDCILSYISLLNKLHTMITKSLYHVRRSYCCNYHCRD